jgi:predicted lysophospholipase L1 biosynthesis ABC-type transport system permease subunit
MLREVDLLVRTASDPLGYQSMIRSTLHDLDPSVPVSRVTTLARQMDDWTAPRRFQTALLTVFSAVALTLASIGIYGLLHYSIVQRTREIGIRIALGAGRARLLRRVLMEGLTLAGIGAATGLVGVVLVGRTLRGLAGCLLPAVRTTLVDPLIVLKAD